jgi:hypothetical protein
MDLPGKIVALHWALATGGVPHAFGGALALAWCTEQARGTIDIDLNVFVETAKAGDVLQLLPADVAWTSSDHELLERDGQIRLWWDATPIDLFMNTTDFHADVAKRARSELFMDTEIPFLACSDVAVFKAFFNRTKDWADIEAMLATGSVDVDRVVGVLSRYLSPADERIDRLIRLL